MLQQIDDNLAQFVYETARYNMRQLVNCDLQNFRVYAISEGVFLCSIFDGKYCKIVVRLDKLNPLKNTLITSPKAVEILSAYEFHQKQIGPELLCVFKNGRIEEWIDGQPIGNRFNNDRELRKLVAKCVAKINSIDDVKCEKNGDFLANKVNIFLKLISKTKSNENYSMICDFVNTTLRQNCPASELNESSGGKNDEKIVELENQFKFLAKSLIISNCSSEILFSHNDLSQENIYCRLDQTNPQQIYVLNYDLTGYNYRGYDLAHYLNNIAFDFENPPTNISQLNFIDDEEMKQFLCEYLNELKELTKDEPIKLERLIKEVKFFRIYSAYLSILVSLLTNLSNESTNLEFLKLRIDFYLKLKNEFLAL